MKKFQLLILILTIVFFGCAHSQAPLEAMPLTGQAEEKKGGPSPEAGEKPVSTELFSVSSEDLDPVEGLNRVAGQYDLGHASKEYTYKSKSHERSDPLHERSHEEVSN